MWSCWVETNLCGSFCLLCLWRSNYQERESWDPMNQFNPVIFLCLSQAICYGLFVCYVFWRSNYQERESWGPMHQFNLATFLCLSQAICYGLFVLNELWWEVIVHFVDISEIADHHCLTFLFTVKHNMTPKCLKSYKIRYSDHLYCNLINQNKSVVQDKDYIWLHMVLTQLNTRPTRTWAFMVVIAW